jgi:GR25 family glycosyltransferase involved in LPS biosynthesis
MDGDLRFVGKRSLPELVDLCLEDPECVGFNTLGFLKRRIPPVSHLEPSPYFKEGDGLYVHIHRHQSIQKDKITLDCDVFCINLDTRPDRLRHMESNVPFHFNRFSAIDGKNLGVYSETTLWDFLRQVEGKERVLGEIGVSLSHYSVWKKVSKNTLILEDDVLFGMDSGPRISNLEQYLGKTDLEWDIIYVGGQWTRNYGLNSQCYMEVHKVRDEDIGSKFIFQGGDLYRRINREQSLFDSPLFRTAAAYVISLKGAEKLLKLAESDKYQFLSTPLDIWILKMEKEESINILDYFNHPIYQGGFNLVSDKCLLRNDIHRGTSQKVVLTPIPQKTIRVKMIGNYWPTGKELCDEFRLMIPHGKESYDNIFITHEDHDIDYYVIINMPPSDGSLYDPKKTIVFTMEPEARYSKFGRSQWGDWFEPDHSKFLHVHSHQRYLNVAQWKFKIPCEILTKPFQKEIERVATIISYKNYFIGHKKRIDFVRYVESRNKNMIDAFGRSNFHNFECYTGSVKNEDTSSVLIPYKYYFMAENNWEHNYATEKIWEPILCESLCFYWGCPNLEDYIDPRSFVRVDLDDFEKSYATMVQAISENWWEQRIQYIRQAREKILNELGFFPTIKTILKSDDSVITKY